MDFFSHVSDVFVTLFCRQRSTALRLVSRTARTDAHQFDHSGRYRAHRVIKFPVLSPRLTGKQKVSIEDNLLLFTLFRFSACRHFVFFMLTRVFMAPMVVTPRTRFHTPACEQIVFTNRMFRLSIRVASLVSVTFMVQLLFLVVVGVGPGSHAPGGARQPGFCVACYLTC